MGNSAASSSGAPYAPAQIIAQHHQNSLPLRDQPLSSSRLDAWLQWPGSISVAAIRWDVERSR